MIKANNIVKKFMSGGQEIIVLKGLSLHVPTGQFVAVTGRSGSGKSTLLYQLGMLDTPQEGDIEIDGVKVLGLDEEKRTEFRLKKLGFVFQDYALVPELTAIDNVMLPMLMAGMSTEEALYEAHQALAALDLTDQLHKLPSQMSGGQQQRVSIARAVAHKPKILYADEPTANLDSETSEQVIEAFERLHELGQTILMITHEPEYASRAERIVTLADGVIVSDEKTNI